MSFMNKLSSDPCFQKVNAAVYCGGLAQAQQLKK
jgi:hypothetical protein